MKKIFLFLVSLISFQAISQQYTPSEANLAERQAFQDRKYGMFIHWGLSSMLGDGEWVMNNKGISKNDYGRLMPAFDPSKFNADQWVSIAKNAGMKYIIFITRHHDSFSNWDTKQSDWKITNTPFHRDALKELAEACKKQDMKLGLYYSTLDWYRDDYPFETGRTGQKSGRKGKGDYASYLKFMKAQLTELLTNYGEIHNIWFDGHWDQTNPEGSADRKARIDWKYDEIYSLIHQLQPACLIGNNHHLDPIPGEDFQMFERDLPGENHSGLSFQQASALPLETCETINGAWGFNITDRKFKTPKQIIHLLVGAAGRNANLLLNVGPMPSGEIQPEFSDSLAVAGRWLKGHGESVYGTRGGPLSPQMWGVTTQTDTHVYVHLLKRPQDETIYIPGNYKKGPVSMLGETQTLAGTVEKQGIHIDVKNLPPYRIDLVLKLEKAK